MNRRSLFKLFGGAAAAYALPLPAVAAPAAPIASHAAYDPLAYMGDFAWLNTAVSEVWHQRQREVCEALTKTPHHA